MKKCGKYYFKMLNILTMLLLMFFLRIEVNTINLKQHTMRPRGEKMLTCPCGPTLLCVFVEAAHRTKKSKGQLSWAVLGYLLGFYWIIDIHANYRAFFIFIFKNKISKIYAEQENFQKWVPVAPLMGDRGPVAHPVGDRT